MLIVGLFAPELVAYIAWYQRQAAVKLTAKMKRLLDDPPGPKHEDLLAQLLNLLGFRRESEHSTNAETQKHTPRRRQPWTNVHSFYAVMGGFAFDTSASTPSFLPNGRTRLTLNLRGLVYVAEKAPWLLPDLSGEFIKDKSKASGLAKLLVCLQALWFCVQCILRLTQGYAISLLELNVFGHCVCALLIYALWWNKPLDVEEPTLLSGEEAWRMCALMCMASCRPKSWLTRMSDLLPWDDSLYLTGGELVNGEQFGSEPYYTWKDLLHFNFDRPNRESLIPLIFFEWSPYQDSSSDQECDQAPSPGKVRQGQRIFGFVCRGPWTPFDLWLEHESRVLPEHGRYFSYYMPAADSSYWLDDIHLHRLDLFSKAAYQFSPVIDRVEIYRKDCAFVNTLSDRMGNWPDPEAMDLSYENHKQWSFASGFAISLAVFLYGGLHLLAWNAPFASKVEQRLWQFSGTFVAFSGLLYLTSLILSNLITKQPHFVEIATGWTYIRRLAKLDTRTIVALILAMAYVLARSYLIIECFLQLARLPESAYLTPSWSRYFPHIS